MELFFQKWILNFIVQFLRMNASTPPIEHEFTVTSHHNISSVELSAQNTIKPLFISQNISAHFINSHLPSFRNVFIKCQIVWNQEIILGTFWGFMIIGAENHDLMHNQIDF